MVACSRRNFISHAFNLFIYNCSAPFPMVNTEVTRILEAIEPGAKIVRVFAKREEWSFAGPTLVYVSNLSTCPVCCATHQKAKGQEEGSVIIEVHLRCAVAFTGCLKPHVPSRFIAGFRLSKEVVQNVDYSSPSLEPFQKLLHDFSVETFGGTPLQDMTFRYRPNHRDIFDSSTVAYDKKRWQFSAKSPTTTPSKATQHSPSINLESDSKTEIEAADAPTSIETCADPSPSGTAASARKPSQSSEIPEPKRFCGLLPSDLD